MSSLACDDHYIYAAVTYSGTYRSSDNGASWVRKSNGLTDLNVGDIVVSGPNLCVGSVRGVFLSTDHGDNWSPISIPSAGSPRVLCMTKLDSIVVACSDSCDILRSTDNGETWSSKKSGCAYFTDLLPVGEKLYAATSGHGIYISDDYGASWALVSTGIFNTLGVSTLAVGYSQLHGTVLYAGTYSIGVWWSFDGGAHWEATGLHYYYISSMYVNGSTLLAGSEHWTLISRDYGANWTELKNELKGTTVSNFISRDSLLLAATSAGFAFSGDGASSWTFSNRGITSGMVQKIVACEKMLFAGTYGSGLFKSTNEGLSWEECGRGITAKDVRDIVECNGSVFVGTYGGGVFRSTNEGENWTAVNDGLTSKSVTTLAFRDTVLLAGTNGGSGVHLSTNMGLSWGPDSIGLTSTSVHRLMISGSTDFAGTFGGGLFRRSGSGGIWERVGVGLSDGHILALAELGSWIFCVNHRGVSWSSDAGSTWSDHNSGLPSWRCSDLCVKGADLFLGHSQGGVYSFLGAGTQWNSISSRLEWLDVRALGVNNRYLMAGTLGGGIWLRPLSEITGGIPLRADLPGNDPKLDQNYPNPFNPSTTIKFELPVSSMVRLGVYDILGREVSVLVNERKSAGVYEVRLDASGLSSGVYFYRIQAGDFTQTRKLLLVH
jgi:hypothetical protein